MTFQRLVGYAAVCTAMCLCLMMAAPAFGQEGGATIVPPRPGKADTPGVVLPYLLGVVIVGLVVGANLLPSKRGHQD